VVDIWHDKTVSTERKNEALKIALETLAALQQAGCNWRKDCKPEHFFVTEDNQVYLIDVERMRFGRRPLDEEDCKQQKERFMSFLINN
jgi:predicted Ser/Thr protein kinase